MHPGADVFGTVRDTTGAPVAGLTVYSTLDGAGIGFLSSMCCQPTFTAATDSEGRYRIYGQQPGPTMVSVREPYYRDGMGGRGYSTTAGSGTPLDLTDGGPDCAFALSDCSSAPPEPSATTS